MALPKLGEVWQAENGGPRYIVTGRYPQGVTPVGTGFVVWTPIPEGCEPQDLGRKFEAATLNYQMLEPDERLTRWPDKEPQEG